MPRGVAEEKIENLFQVGVKMVFGLDEEKKKEFLRKISREWNKDHNVKGEGCLKLKKFMLIFLQNRALSVKFKKKKLFLSDADGPKYWW